eukprot:TRINITY_DN336_c0_g2_i1.p1 TRINITY_DN336_c0_g2~~TRINITY_DN336_c0_g2_i1.p1  ORF type:complete len:374 (+),score=59.61 TRINITY_DN336_c0_g2_i1:49-1170(+)
MRLSSVSALCLAAVVAAVFVAAVPLPATSDHATSDHATSDHATSDHASRIAIDCPAAPATPADRRRDTSVLSVVTYNAEWLFYDGGSGASVCPGDGCPWPDQATATSHFRSIAAVLSKLDADIVVMQELESCDALTRLLSYMPNGDLYRPYMVKGTDTSTGQQVGIITKVDPIMNVTRTENRANYPIAGSQCGSTASGSSGVSKHLYTKFLVNRMTIALASAHFLAFPDDKGRCVQREAQSTVLRDYIRSKTDFSSEELIVLGDLNDFDEQIPDANNNMPISSVLKIQREVTTPNLYNVAAKETNQLERYSSWYDRNGNCRDDGASEHSSIDHMLVTSGLASRISSMKYDHSYAVSCESTYSDHFPIYVQFRV